jgi:hypothetical protein
MASYILKIELSMSFRNTHFLGMVFLDLVPGNPGVTITAAIAVVMALWVTEALPIVTSLLPIIFFPYLVF